MEPRPSLILDRPKASATHRGMMGWARFPIPTPGLGHRYLPKGKRQVGESASSISTKGGKGRVLVPEVRLANHHPVNVRRKAGEFMIERGLIGNTEHYHIVRLTMPLISDKGELCGESKGTMYRLSGLQARW